MSITTTGDRLDVLHDSDEVRAPARPTFTITDAATSCSVSRKTITRKLPELAGHGAAKDDDGVWRIPVEALLAIGMHPGRSLPESGSAGARALPPAPLPVRPAEQDTITIPRDRWDDVRIRLARAEAEATERGFALADARLALRALTAGPVVPDRAASPASGPGVSAPQERAEANAAPLPADPPATLGAIALDAALSTSDTGLPPVPADVVAARNHAARTGGYVPAGATPVTKRRWWQSR